MPTSQEVPDGTAPKFHCTAPGCTYNKRDVCGIVLHMRTHFVYETTEEDMLKATFLFKDGIYRCLDCDRKTDNRISFREHVRHHILPFPYRCHCGTTVASIPDLRRHSSSAHPRTPLQMYFEDAEQLLEDIFTEIGPQKRTFWFPQRASHDSPPEPEIISNFCKESISGRALNESNVIDVERNDDSGPGILVCKTNAEPKRKENCGSVPLSNGSESGNCSSSGSASVLEFSAEYNYINAFSYSTTTTVSDSSGFCVLNVPDVELNKCQIDCVDHVVQGKPENLPADQQCLSLSENNGQTPVVSDSELSIVFSHAIGCDAEISPISRENRTESELECLSLDEPLPTSGPGKFAFHDEKFKCLTCLNWESDSEQLFKKHVWQHFHGISRICSNVECLGTDCPLVLGMVMLVKNCCQSLNISEHPHSSMPTVQLSTERKASNKSSSNRSALEDFCDDVEPSSPRDGNFAAQKRKVSTTKTQKTYPHRNLTENLTIMSKERLRFSAPTLNTLRTKACKHLSFNSDLVGDDADKGDTIRNDQEYIAVEDVYCVTNPELSDNESDAAENICTAVSGENDTSPRRRKQTLTIKHDANQPVEYCRYSRDSTPLSTVCVQCSYTCNCSVQLGWHMESCHSKQVRRKKEFCCTECHFSDNSKDTLIWHMAHHIGEHSLKVFSCKYCHKQSTLMRRMMKHMYRFHPGKPSVVKRESTNIAYMDGIFKCPFCCSGYPWGSLFFKHIEVQHGLKKLADHLFLAYRSKCCPEVIEFPKHFITQNMEFESSKDNERSLDKNDPNESTRACLTEKENVSKILQPKQNTNGSINLSHSRNYTETGERTKISELDAPQKIELKTTVSENTDLCSAKCQVFKRRGNIDKNFSRDIQKLDTGKNSKTNGSNLNQPKGNTGHMTLKRNFGKSTQNDVVYNSTKCRIKRYRAPKASKSSFLISPSRVPTLPRNLGNHSASDFEKSLPNEFIFSQAIKCPKCYHTDRIRLNLIRHYNAHSRDANKGVETSVSNVAENRGDGVTFDLWNPKKFHKVPEKCVGNIPKNHVVVSEDNKQQQFQKASKTKQSERYKRPIKRPSVADELSKCDASDSKRASRGMVDTTNSGSVNSNDDAMSGHSVTTHSNIQTTSTSLVSSPAFGQFLQNHARKIVTMHTCESCSRTFSSETEFEKHAMEIHSSMYYLCRCCGIMIRGLSNAHSHFKELHPGSQVLVDEWVSANKESQKRGRPFSEVSNAEIRAKKTKIATDDEKQLPEKSDFEKDDLPKGQKWSSFYGANLRKQPASSMVQVPAVGASIDDFSTLNTTLEMSLSCSSQTTRATTASMTYTSTGGNIESALGVPSSESMTSTTSHSVTSSNFPPPVAAGNNLFATFMTNLLAANLMATKPVPATQMQAMPVMGPPQVPSAVVPSAPVMMTGSTLAVPRMQAPVVDTSGLANLLAGLLMANLTGSGMNVSNENPAVPRETTYPFQPAGYNLNVMKTSTNQQNDPLMPELIREASEPSSHGSNNYGSSSVSVQNDACVASVSGDKPYPSLALATLVPGTSSVLKQHGSLDSARKPKAVTRVSKVNRLSDYDNRYSSEAESVISGVSYRSNCSKSSGSISNSKKSSKRPLGAQKQKRRRFVSYNSESSASDSEICSRTSSISTTDLSKKELLSVSSSTLSVAESLADCAIRMCCNQCAYKTKKLDHFENHLTGHFGKKQPAIDPKLWQPVLQKCGFCNFRTYLDDEFEDHIATHMIKKPFQCSYCSFSGFKKVAIVRHLGRFHPELEPKVRKNQNVRLKQTMLHSSVTKVSLNAVVKLKDVLDLSNKALKKLCKKHKLVKLNLKE